MDLSNSPGLVLPLIVVVLLALEWFSPLSRTKSAVRYRWTTNLGLMLIGGLTISIIFTNDLQSLANELPSGRLRDLQLPLAFEALIVFLLLDCWRYWEHRLFHEVPLLWRAHLVHHSDTGLDITTAQRHHPVEAVLVTCTAMLLLFALGFSAQSLAVYLMLATIWALLTHANIQLTEKLDRTLRLLLVTPAVHAIHHSSLPAETNSNYGTVLTLWDRLFGTYNSPSEALVPRYGLEYFHLLPDTALGPVLLQPFEYRPEKNFYAGPIDAPEPPSVAAALSLSGAWKTALWQLAIGLSVVLIVLWPTVLSLLQVWSDSEPYQYAWALIPMFIYIAGWHLRDTILALTPEPDHAGILLILPAIVIWAAAFIVDIHAGQHFALMLVIQGIALSILGRRIYATIFPLMAMLFLMVPCGDVLQPLLRELTVKWIEWFALLFNLPYSIDGFVTHVGDHRYVVVDACSGLTFALMGGFLGYSFGLLLFRQFGKVVALGVTGALLGILTNAMRVWLIVGIDWLQESQMDMAAHINLQWLALVVSMGLLLYFTLNIADDEEPLSATSPAPHAASQRSPNPLAPAVAALILFVSIGSLQLISQVSQQNGNKPLQNLVTQYPGSIRLDEENAANRTLSIPYNDQFEAVLVAPTSRRGRISESQFDPADAGIWRHASTSHFQDCAGNDCIDFVHKSWKRKDSDQIRHSYYAYFVGDTVTDSKLGYRLASGWNRIIGHTDSVGVLGFRVRSAAIPGPSQLARAFLEVRHRY